MIPDERVNEQVRDRELVNRHVCLALHSASCPGALRASLDRLEVVWWGSDRRLTMAIRQSTDYCFKFSRVKLGLTTNFALHYDVYVAWDTMYVWVHACCSF